MEDWAHHPDFSIDPENRWWKLYLDLVRELSDINASYTTQSTAYSLMAVAEQLSGHPSFP